MCALKPITCGSVILLPVEISQSPYAKEKLIKYATENKLIWWPCIIHRKIMWTKNLDFWIVIHISLWTFYISLISKIFFNIDLVGEIEVPLITLKYCISLLAFCTTKSGYLQDSRNNTRNKFTYFFPYSFFCEMKFIW